MYRSDAALLAVWAYMAVCGMFCGTSLACSPTGFTVGDNLNALATPEFNADASYKRYAVITAAATLLDK
jgi:hypothetical protein